jgi:hypothetical protein
MYYYLATCVHQLIHKNALTIKICVYVNVAHIYIHGYWLLHDMWEITTVTFALFIDVYRVLREMTGYTLFKGRMRVFNLENSLSKWVLIITNYCYSVTNYHGLSHLLFCSFGLISGSGWSGPLYHIPTQNLFQWRLIHCRTLSDQCIFFRWWSDCVLAVM